VNETKRLEIVKNVNGLYFDHFLLLEALLRRIGRHDINLRHNDIIIIKFLFLYVETAPVVVKLSS
jgi:hypothetical protein